MCSANPMALLSAPPEMKLLSGKVGGFAGDVMDPDRFVQRQQQPEYQTVKRARRVASQYQQPKAQSPIQRANIAAQADEGSKTILGG